MTSTYHTTEQHLGASFTVGVLKRILAILSENGKMKRTTLAGKTGLNYVVCLKYVSFMKTLGWIELGKEDDGNEHVSVTHVGRQVASALSDFLLGKDNSSVDYSSASGADERVASKQNDSPEFQSTPKQEQEPDGDPSRKAQPRILLIDDEPDVALTYKSFLSSEGYHVDAFREPERALEHFIASRPSHYDLLITDIRMPEINGLKLFQCVKIIDPSVKVIFVTALDAAEELVSLLSPEPVMILRKPVDRQVFGKYVKSALQQ